VFRNCQSHLLAWTNILDSTESVHYESVVFYSTGPFKLLELLLLTPFPLYLSSNRAPSSTRWRN